MSFWFCTIFGLFFVVVIFFNLFMWNIFSYELEVIFYIQYFSTFSIVFFLFTIIFLSIIFIFWLLNNRNIHYNFTYNTIKLKKQTVKPRLVQRQLSFKASVIKGNWSFFFTSEVSFVKYSNAWERGFTLCLCVFVPFLAWDPSPGDQG